MNDEIVVGTRVRAKRPMMGFQTGTVGFVYETYHIGKDFGVSVIFSNGAHDGFSEDDFYHLDFLDVDPRYSLYEFRNVNQVWNDYRTGYWNFD